MIIYQIQVQKPFSMNPISAKPLFGIKFMQDDVNNSNVTPASHNIKKSLKLEKFHVRFAQKYNHKRFYMNDAGYISIDMNTFHKSELPAIA